MRELVKVVILLAGTLISVDACHPQFARELRYLELYLGIKPDGDGELPIQHASKFMQYISSPDDLSCTFDKECLWANLDTDGVLDSSDFWYFHKSDSKVFPEQLQPGEAKIPVGSHFAIAGNTTVHPQSAVLLSAPVPCQKGEGLLSFNYWLYNFAQLQILVVKPVKRRNRLQIITKPEIDCHYYRPKNDVCQVTIPHVDEPFRIAIRAYSLKDNVVGSMALLHDIRYVATICEESPGLFSSEPLSSSLPLSSPVTSLSDLDCLHPATHCRWANAGPTSNSSWRLGTDTEKWSEIMVTGAKSSRPSDNFLFLAVDSLTPGPFAKFVSDLIPCTQKPTTLSFKYWAKVGTQVEVCSVDEGGVSFSCAYLTEEDSPGPVEIVVDPYSKPFRFSFEVINFDSFAGGLVAISDIKLAGMLCSQEAPPVLTTIQPNTFAIAPRPAFRGTYPLGLSCDWTTDTCFQWVDDDGKLFVGVAPEDSDDFPFPEHLINGNVGVLFLHGVESIVVHSREVACAYNLQLTVTYWRSEHGYLRLCALGQCVDGAKREGKIALTLSSMKPFEVTLEARSRDNAVVVLDSMLTEGDSCPLKTLEQTLCDDVKCPFDGSFCGYAINGVSTGDVPMQLTQQGASVVIPESSNRAVLGSSSFQLVAPALLKINVTQETFGSRVLLCPDAKSEPDACNELLGPSVLRPRTQTISFPLDPSTRRFALVLLHDKGAQFGPGSFAVHSIDVKTSDDYQLCF